MGQSRGGHQPQHSLQARQRLQGQVDQQQHARPRGHGASARVRRRRGALCRRVPDAQGWPVRRPVRRSRPLCSVQGPRCLRGRDHPGPMGDARQVQEDSRGGRGLRCRGPPAAHIRSRRPPHVPRIRLSRRVVGARPPPGRRGRGGDAPAQAGLGRNLRYRVGLHLGLKVERHPRHHRLIRQSHRLGSRRAAIPPGRRGLHGACAPPEHGAGEGPTEVPASVLVWVEGQGLYHGPVSLLPDPLCAQHGQRVLFGEQLRLRADHGGQHSGGEGLSRQARLLFPRRARGGDQAGRDDWHRLDAWVADLRRGGGDAQR
mmetsp:Transcript_2046/g.5158  ORF Transcript_2046/g.5158 Transcript_2046/m.5158 type:complete len:315 (+) Transcript_2046:242-1186(+)